MLAFSYADGVSGIVLNVFPAIIINHIFNYWFCFWDMLLEALDARVAYHGDKPGCMTVSSKIWTSFHLRYYYLNRQCSPEFFFRLIQEKYIERGQMP